MKRNLFGMAAGLCIAGSLMSSRAFAATTTNYNSTITAIYGTGNPNGPWVSVYDTTSKLVLALMADNRTTGSVPNNGAGTYSFAPGFAPSSTKALWNYAFSIDVNPTGAPHGSDLDDFEFYLGVSSPLHPGVFTVVNALTFFSDDAYGKHSTPNGGGSVGTAAMYASIDTVAQNSENIVFSGFSPDTTGIYQFELYAVDCGGGPKGKELDKVVMDVNVQAVPEPSSVALTGIGFLALFGLARFGTRRA